jgi:hypothetical protein
MLSTSYPNAPIIMGADKNSMDIKPLLNCGLRLKQVTLDILITNILQYFNSPILISPLSPVITLMMGYPVTTGCLSVTPIQTGTTHHFAVSGQLHTGHYLRKMFVNLVSG